MLASSVSCSTNMIETAWQPDCNALVALFYLAFAGGSVAEQVVELHLSLFLVKWFHSTDGLLQVAASVHPSYCTDTFVTMTLLYCCLQRQHLLPKADVGLFLETLKEDRKDADPPMNPSHASLWLKQVVGSSTPYTEVITSLKSWVLFAYDIPTDNSDLRSHVGNVSEFSTLLHIALHYQRHSIIGKDSKFNKQPITYEDCTAFSSLSATIQDNRLQACLYWLNGVMAVHKNKHSLACTEFRTTFETSVDCSAVLYNAYLAFSRRGVHDASLECLQLLIRSCRSPPRKPASCLSYTAALLAPLLPKPCQHGVTALLSVVCLRRQRVKEARELLSSLLADPSLRDVTVPAVPPHPRPLLLARDCPPPCPGRSVLLSQAVIAAARLQETRLLGDLLEATDEDASTVRWRCFYTDDGPTRAHTLSAILCALMRVSRNAKERPSSEAMIEAARLLEATSWISPASNCPDGAPSLLVVTSVLCKAFLLSILCRLHSDIGNEASARHFERLKRQAFASVEKIAAIELETLQTEMAKKPKMQIRVTDQLKQEEQLFDVLDEPRSLKRKTVCDEAKDAINFHCAVNRYCDTSYLISHLDETSLISVQNIATFLSEQLQPP